MYSIYSNVKKKKKKNHVWQVSLAVILMSCRCVIFPAADRNTGSINFAR